MNLVLDFGNTRIKAALFNGNKIQSHHVFNSELELLNTTTLFSSEVKHCIIGSVTQAHITFLNQFKSQFIIQLFEATTRTPLINLYKSALTLGSDRLAASVGSFCEFPNQNVLTIDVGTCIKYNVVNAQNQYLGGAISPGIPMRLKAMNYFTAALPLLEVDKNYEKLIGQSSAESLLSGAMIGTICEVDEMINRYQKFYDNLQVVITGGDADYLCKQLKNRFFGNQNLVLQGLNAILNYNLEK
jgi:type III pantothenate kinase